MTTSTSGSRYKQPTVEDAEDETASSVLGPPADTAPSVSGPPADIKRPDQFQSERTTVGSPLMKSNVKYFREGAHFIRKQDKTTRTLDVYPKGEPTFGTVIGPSNAKGHIDPFTASISVPGDTENSFDKVRRLGQGGRTFGSFKPGQGSVVYLKKGFEPDPNDDYIEGDATEYVEYGPVESIP